MTSTRRASCTARGELDGEQVQVAQTLGDRAASIVSAWRVDPAPFEVLWPDARRAAARAAIKAWVVGEARAVVARRPTRVLAPGPVMPVPWSEARP